MKNKSNKSWLKRHLTDPYVQQAQHDGYRSRAAYKLLEINAQANLFKQANVVVDLGATPGSWSQVALKQLKQRTCVPTKVLTKLASFTLVAIDILPMLSLNDVEFIQGDFTETATIRQLTKILADQPIDLILSDMAPNLSGIKMVDQSRMAELGILVLELAQKQLKTGGTCLMKTFQGEEFSNIKLAAKQIFTQVVSYKPDASRDESSELYLICSNKK